VNTSSPAANGANGKRKARASTSEPESKNVEKLKINGSASENPSREVKRVRRGSTPRAGGSRAVKKEASAYTVRKGINALTVPVPAVTKSMLEAGLASTATAAISAEPAPNVASLVGKGETLMREMFVFGNGDMGQHGLGTEALDEIKRPRKHVWVTKANEDGKLGKGGLEMIAAGGMHSLAIDSTGRVSRQTLRGRWEQTLRSASLNSNYIGSLVGHQRQRCPWSKDHTRSRH
jgi:hypothetical protein